ncbi:hypothetical protein BH09ACT5_BH09ACT5_14270 [soil metagenome]
MAKDSLVELAGEALRQRITACAPHILSADPDPDATTMALLHDLAARVRADRALDLCWLLMTCVAGAMPTRDQLLECFRQLELAEAGTEHFVLLRATAGLASANGNIARPVTIVEGAVVVDVDFTARHGHNTGIQRVVRETLARWSTEQELALVAWTEDGIMTRSLVTAERARVLEWTSDRIHEHSTLADEDAAGLVVPWNCTVVLPEVAQARIWESLSCLGEFSPNRLVAVGYDAIPVTSAEYVIPTETDRFVRYLSVIKHVDVVAGISESSSEEFAGFFDALEAQGLQSGRVVTVRLPVALASRVASEVLEPRVDEVPLVVCVGTQEPRKNQLAVLAAAEALWQEGLAFELLFIGSAAMPLSVPFDIELERLQKLGRRVSVKRQGSDAFLEAAYRDARFSVFVSLHEGYGLPVGESLAVGTPVVVTRYGSIAEIARDGGCLLVDPRDDAAIAAGMRTLLLDDEVHAQLARAAASRPPRTWDDYAGELWSVVADVAAGASR